MLDFLSSLMYYIQALNTHCDSLAQLAEHLTFNQGVRGSNPRWLTRIYCISVIFSVYAFFIIKAFYKLSLYNKKDF